MSKVCTDELTVGQVRELMRLVGINTPALQRGTIEDHPYQVGKNYLIRTVTFAYTGRLVRVTAQELVLEDAAWIADLGRFADAFTSGDFSEIEPYPSAEVIIGRGSIVDAVMWEKALPRKQK